MPASALDTPWVRELVVRLGPWLEAQLPALEGWPVQTRTAGGPSAPGRAQIPGMPTNSGGVREGGAQAGSFSGCLDLFPGGRPPELLHARPGLRALCFDAFAILYSAETKTAVYVVERLQRAGLRSAQSIARTDRFYPEARLPGAAQAQLEDYRHSGYARGHLAPAGDMPTDSAMDQSFSLANIVPQDPTHNGGAWSQIERDTRQYVMRARGPVYVFTGPAYQDGRAARIGESGVAVPSHLFKLVHDPATGRAWAHWQQNAAAAQPMKPIAYPALVQKVGIDFLHTGD